MHRSLAPTQSNCQFHRPQPQPRADRFRLGAGRRALRALHARLAPFRATGLAACLAAVLAAAPAASPQGAPFALETADGGAHRLWLVDESTLATQSVGTFVNFLPLRLAGYARTERLRLDLARAESGPPEHIRLPALGSLYRVRVPGASQLLVVRPNGQIESLLEVPEVIDAPALLEWMHVARDGNSVLVATSLAAGGNVLLVTLQPGGSVLDLTAGEPPLEVAARSLRHGGQRAWFLSGQQIARVDLGNPGLGTPLTWLSPDIGLGDPLHDETAMADDGSAFAVVSGQAPGSRLIHVVGSEGPVQLLTPTPGPYDLPSLDSPIGPLLTVAPDGGRVAWRTASQASKELFVRPVAQPTPPTQLTADALFIDTIDNVGILGFKDPVQLVFFAGEAGNAAQPIGSADVFVMDTATPGAAPLNVSQTSGDPVAPYTAPGELEILAAYQDPLNERMLLVVDPQGGDVGLLAVPTDGSPGLSSLVPTMLSPPIVQPVGTSVLLLMQPEPPSPFSHQLAVLRPAGSSPATQVLASVTGTGGLAFDRFVTDRGGQRVAFVASAGPAIQLPVLADLAAGSIGAAWAFLFAVSPGIAFSPAGRLSVGVGSPGGPSLFLGFDAPHVGVLYPLPAARGFPLAN